MNEVISHEKLYEYYNTITIRYAEPTITYIFGKRVVVRKSDVVLMESCSWCGATDKALDENNNCAHCGGWVTV